MGHLNGAVSEYTPISQGISGCKTRSERKSKLCERRLRKLASRTAPLRRSQRPRGPAALVHDVAAWRVFTYVRGTLSSCQLGRQQGGPSLLASTVWIVLSPRWARERSIPVGCAMTRAGSGRLLRFAFFLLAFDYTPWTITNSESVVAWRSAFGSAYSGEAHHSRARSMLGNSPMISRSRGHSPSRT